MNVKETLKEIACCDLLKINFYTKKGLNKNKITITNYEYWTNKADLEHYFQYSCDILCHIETKDVDGYLLLIYLY